MPKNIQIALTGNPNCGKSSLFNCLTGLNQKVGNFPGVTVEKKSGIIALDNEVKATITDLPGTYSLYPRRADEWVAYQALMGVDAEVKPNVIVVVLDASNLKRNLLFCSQIMDLKIPVVAALAMQDIAEKKGILINTTLLQQQLGIPIVVVNPRKGKGINTLKKTVLQTVKLAAAANPNTFVEVTDWLPSQLKNYNQLPDYKNLHFLINYKNLPLTSGQQNHYELVEKQANFSSSKTQAQEVIARYQRINQIMQTCVQEPNPLHKKIFTDKLDNLLLHRTWGYLILLSVLFILFQSVFWFAQFPMDGIEWSFNQLAAILHQNLPNNMFTNLLVDGIVAGLSGIVVFVPQIMILFGLITMLEDSGYMARISFLSDKLMRKVGLNGKSVMPMISAFACAVPAIMGTRSIENRKEKLLTIFVTPFMSCSARLPVYTILIGLVVPNTYYFGVLSLQGLVMMGLYLSGIIIALLTALVGNLFIKATEKSFFILELPVYRMPRWKNVATTMLQKAKIFVLNAGKIIMIISLVLWFLSNFGPSNSLKKIDQQYAVWVQQNPQQKDSLEKQAASQKLQQSYIGRLGQVIEPAIQPIGFDWKIGIALITSFAAREVFVGTMATLYAVEAEDDTGLRSKLQQATNSQGKKIYTAATTFSLLIFYVLALQCMSTIAVVKRETKSWKIAWGQFVFMGVLAYAFSFLVYQLLS